MSKAKEIPYSVVEEIENGKVHEAYELMRELIREQHTHLAAARIQICWRYNWKPDKDGRMKLGEMRLCADPDRLLHERDFVMSLNYKAWQMMMIGQHRAVIDHELTHCQVELEEDGETVKMDTHGRIVYRLRGHDIEEFSEVVLRNGAYMPELESFGTALRQGETEGTKKNGSVMDAAIKGLKFGGVAVKVG